MVEHEQDEAEELLTRARRRDPAAWDALYRAHEAALYSWIHHRAGGDRALADDVFHEVFLRAVERIAQFDPARGRFGAWLTGIARNELRQRLRARRDQVGAVVLDPPAPEPGSEGDLHRLVNLTFTALPVRYQRALALKYQEGRTLEEIARDLDTTPAAVGSLLHRARAAFRAMWERGGEP